MELELTIYRILLIILVCATPLIVAHYLRLERRIRKETHHIKTDIYSAKKEFLENERAWLKRNEIIGKQIESTSDILVRNLNNFENRNYNLGILQSFIKVYGTIWKAEYE